MAGLKQIKGNLRYVAWNFECGHEAMWFGIEELYLLDLSGLRAD